MAQTLKDLRSRDASRRALGQPPAAPPPAVQPLTYVGVDPSALGVGKAPVWDGSKWQPQQVGASSLTMDLTGATSAVDVATVGPSGVLKGQLTRDTAVSFANARGGSRWFMELRQDGTAGRKVTWSGITWIPYGPPTLSTAPNAVDLFEFVSPDGTTIYGFPITSVEQPPGQFATPSKVENMTRVQASTVVGLASGFVIWTHFERLQRDITVTAIETVCRGTAAVGGTHGRVAVAAVTGASQDGYSVRGRSVDTATRWSGQGKDSAPIADDGAASPAAATSAALFAGEIPAVGAFFTGTTPPQLEGSPKHVSEVTDLPRLASTSAGAQTDIAASYAALAGSGSHFRAALVLG